MIDAYLNDPDVVDAMASNFTSMSSKSSKPSLFGWTAELNALKDIQDQMIASRGGNRFVPRPTIPGMQEGWRRKDAKLTNIAKRICGTE